MKCEQVDQDALELYALGRLSDADSELTAHLETCEECKGKVQDARNWAALFRRAVTRSPGCLGQKILADEKGNAREPRSN